MNQILEVKRTYIICILCDVIRRAAAAFLFIIFPQKIVACMLQGQFREGKSIAVVFCCLILLNEIVIKILSGEREKVQAAIHINLNSKLSSAMIECEYEKVERKSYLDHVEFGRKCMERNSVFVIYQSVVDLLSGIISLFGIFYIICNLEFWLVGLILISVIVSSIGEIFRINHIYTRYQQGNDIERNLYYARNDLSENQYAKDIRIWNLYHFISSKVEYYAKQLCNLWSETAIKSVKIVGWTYLLNGMQSIIVYSFLAYLTYQSKIGISDFVLYSSATVVFGESMKSILNAFIASAAESKYIDGIICAIDGNENKAQWGFEIPKYNHTIEFIDVWFRFYGSDEYVIKGLNLRMEKNKTYSLVGRNGAGKTTLVKLLLGLYKPEKGTILLDGVSINQINPKKYRTLFSCVFQDFNIYNFSIRDNIAFSSRIEEGKIKDSIARVGLEEKVSSLKDGMDTLLGREINENATMLSGGQEQQLAIARALFKDSDIYILDEPTAALSPNNEFRLYQEFNDIAKDKTIIFISHRLSSCVLCNEVIVLEDGKITEKGNHELLINNNGLYANMFLKQAEPYFE